MIEDLTKEKLIEYKFKNETIERLLTWENYETVHFIKDFYCYWASNIEGKIYSEVDAQRKYFFRNGVIAFPFSGIALHSEYYQKSLSKYLVDKKKRLGNGFDEIEAINKFIGYQKRITANSIEELQKSKFKWDGLFLKIEVYEEFQNFLNNKLPAATNQAKGNKKNTAKDEPETRTLKELFKYPNLYEDCLQLLRDIDKPAISDENSFIGKNKGVLVVWYDELEKKQIIEKVVNDKQRAAILTNTFENYSVSEGQFRQDNTRATNDYKTEFSTYLGVIKTKKH